MATLTLNQLASELAQEQGEKVDDSSYINQLEKWIRDAITEISVRSKFKIFWKEFTFSTVIGVSFYSIPKEFRDFKYVRFTDNDDEIEAINPKRLSEYGLDLEQKSRPRFYWISDPQVDGSSNFVQRIRLHPIPNAVLQINAPFYFHPVDLVTSSIIPLSEEALLVIKSRIRMQMHKLDKEWDAFNAERAQYAQDLTSLVEQERTPASKNLTAQPTDLPRRTSRPYRLRYPFE